MPGRAVGTKGYPNANVNPENSLSQGTVAILDILGFKGIWARFHPEEVRHAFGEIREGLDTLVAQSQLPSVQFMPLLGTAVGDFRWRTNEKGEYLFTKITFNPYRFRYSIISDTIAFAYLNIEDQDINTALYVGQAAHWVQHKLAQSKIKALVRGYICSGDLYIGGSTIMGPAVDEAATHLNLSDAACIWAAPNLLGGPYDSLARKLRPETCDSERFFFEWGRFLPRIEVPLKGGGSVETLVVCPFWQKFSGYYTRLERSLANPGGRLDIAIKRNATLKVATNCESRLRELYRCSDLDRLTKVDRKSNFQQKTRRLVETGRAVVVREVVWGTDGMRITWLDGYGPQGKSPKKQSNSRN